MRLLRRNGRFVRRNGRFLRGDPETCECCGTITPPTCCNGGGCCVAHDATSDILLERKVYTVEVAGDHTADLLTSGYTTTAEAGTRFSLTGLVNQASIDGDDFCGIFFTDSGAFDAWMDTGSGYEWVAQDPVYIDHSNSVQAVVFNGTGNVGGAMEYDGDNARFDLFADGDPVYRCCGIALYERTYIIDAYYDAELDMTFGTIAYQKNSTTINNNRCCNCSASCSPTADNSTATCNGAGMNYCTTDQGTNCCLMTCAAAPSSVAVDILSAGTWAACSGAVAPMTLGSWDGTLPRFCSESGGVLTTLNWSKASNIVKDSTNTAFGVVSLALLKDDCKFRLTYACGATIIWQGEKATALLGPLGTYTRTAGTDTTPTRSVT